MKTLIPILVLLALPFLSLEAAQERLVTSLNMDECWVGEIQESSPLKIAHFGSGEALQMSGYDFNKLLTEVFSEMRLHGLNEDQASLETLLHCSSYGASVVLNIKTPQSRVCVWASFKKGSLEWERYGVEPMAHHGHCTGATPGDLILSVSDNADAESIKAELNHLGLWDSQTKLRYVAQRVYAVSLSQKFWFKEEKIIQMIQKKESRSHYNRAAELNYYPHAIGEFMKLEQLSGEL